MFLISMGDLPVFDLAGAERKGEKLSLWRVAAEACHRRTRPIVMGWRPLAWGTAERSYNHWLRLPPLERNPLRVDRTMPLRYHMVEDWMYPGPSQ